MSDDYWSPRKQSLLLYFESCLVDGMGKIDHRRINQEEITWAEQWDDEGLITFRNMGGFVRFTDEAWRWAHQFRRERSDRMIEREESR